MVKSLTRDQGSETAAHHALTAATDIPARFCDPRDPWRWGTDENTNKLLRQYLPEKTDLSRHSRTDLDEIADRLNNRPRKVLGCMAPSAMLQRAVALTG